MSGRPAPLPRQRQGAGRDPCPRASGGGGHVLHRLPLSRRGGHAHQRRRPGPHRGGGVERAGAGQPGTGLRRAGPALCPHHRPHPPGALPPAAAPPPPGVRLRPSGRLGHPAQYDGRSTSAPAPPLPPAASGFFPSPPPSSSPCWSSPCAGRRSCPSPWSPGASTAAPPARAASPCACGRWTSSSPSCPAPCFWPCSSCWDAEKPPRSEAPRRFCFTACTGRRGNSPRPAGPPGFRCSPSGSPASCPPRWRRWAGGISSCWY